MNSNINIFFPVAGTLVGLILAWLVLTIQAREYSSLGFGVKQSKVLIPLHLKKGMLISLSFMLLLVLGGLSYFAVNAYIEAHRPIPEAPMVRITYSQLGAPPSLSSSTVEQVQVASAAVAAAPTMGVPKPVADDKAVDEAAYTQSELGAMSAGMATTEGASGASNLQVEEVVPDRAAYVAVDKAPEIVKAGKAEYPDIVKKAGIEGKVYLQLLIDFDGHVKMAVVAKSSGNVSLDEAAVEAGKQCIFTPAVAPGGKPVRVWVMWPVTFKINQ
ncbi:MAG: energy transducer TonB [Candidatus Edwardsbacteria bacterium]|nr:energy transducer TonB [Candidatus Edwardsbacteria bacterium]